MAINPTIGAYAHNYMMFTFGDWTTDFARLMANKEDGALRTLKGSNLFDKSKYAWGECKTAYSLSQETSMMNNGINATDSWGKYATGMMKSWGAEIAESAKIAKTAGKTSIFGGAKGFFKGAAKRMPLIGTLFMLGMAIPNIWNAFTSPKGGIGTGLLETGKTGLKLGAYAGGAALGATIGTLLFPGVGTLVGGIIGFVASAGFGMAAEGAITKVVGESFTEKQEAEKEKLTQATPQQDLNPAAQAQTATTQNAIAPASNNNLAYNNSSNPFASQNYMDRDIMAMSAGLG